MSMLKSYFISLGIILTVIGLLAFSLYGRNIPRDKDMYRRVGRFVVHPYKYGLYLTQPASGIFYNFSPYDAYYIGEEGLEHRLVERDPMEVYSDEYKQTQKTKSFRNKVYAVLSYFNYFDPSSTFSTSKGTTKLITEAEGNALYVILDKTFYDMPADKVTLTLSINPDDFVFDDSGNLYNIFPPEEVSDFIRAAQFPLSSHEFEGSKRYVLGQQYLFIMNKNMPGVIRLSLNEPQYEVVYVNLDKQAIEFDMKSTGDAKVKVELYDSLKEARESI